MTATRRNRRSLKLLIVIRIHHSAGPSIAHHDDSTDVVTKDISKRIENQIPFQLKLAWDTKGSIEAQAARAAYHPLSEFPAAEALAEAALAAAPESNRQHVKTLVDSAQQCPYALHIHIMYTMADPCDEMNQYTQIFMNVRGASNPTIDTCTIARSSDRCNPRVGCSTNKHSWGTDDVSLQRQ